MQGFFLEKTINSIRDGCKIPLIFVDKTEELLPFIDQQHLTSDLGGELNFDIEDWLTNRIVSSSKYVDSLLVPFSLKYFVINFGPYLALYQDS